MAPLTLSAIAQKSKWFWRVFLCLWLCLLLSGCVDYEVGIRFDSQTHGIFRQTIHLQPERAFPLSSRFLSLEDTQRLFAQLSDRARALTGKSYQIDPDTLEIEIPFYNGAQLVDRFNAFYGSSKGSDIAGAELMANFPGAPAIGAHLSLQQANYLLALRNHLVCDIQIASGRAVTWGQSGSDLPWVTLDFTLVTPWGRITAVEPNSRESVASPKPQLTQATEPPPAQLSPGRVTWHLAAASPPHASTHLDAHLDAVFWIPNPLGIGAVAIALLCLLGYSLKHGVKQPGH